MTGPTERKRGFGARVFSRLLHSGFLVTRGLTIGVRAVVRSDDGKFLLVRHSYAPGWHFPGGGVEKGETTESALVNELRQETGLRISGRPRLHGIFFNRAISKRDHVLVYLCEAEGQVPVKSPSLEIAEAGFFGLDDLPDATDPGTTRRMREIVLGQGQSLDW
jgi:8-oxo-dGTP pyrophosphatase MutT (NUDIX family)